MTKTIYTIFSCLLLIAGVTQAQDIHLSHIHASPTLLNPAMTGIISGGDIRFIANSRVQWESVTNGYKTVVGSVDAKLLHLGKNSILGGGLQLFADKAGDLGFTTTSAAFALSSIRVLDPRGRNMVSLGFQGNLLSNRIDYAKMKGHEPDRMVLEGAANNIKYWDLSVGAAWYYQLSEESFYYLGASLSHINQPEVSFFKGMDEPNDYSALESGKMLYRKLVLHGGAHVRLASYVTALPSFIFMDQGPHQEIKAGTFIKFLKSKSFKKSPYAFYLGGWMRFYMEKDLVGTDALDVSIRMDYYQTSISFSFDFNLSTLTRASHGLGGPELSIVHILTTNERRLKNNRIKCPAF